MPGETAAGDTATSERPTRRLILGLGNPGSRYAGTRHNVGFRVVEELARRRRVAFGGSECNALVAEDERLTLAAPQTFMNRSGHAARCLQERRGFTTEDLLVVYDEIHLPLGTLRLRPGGSPAGHRGLESVLESLGTDRVPRLRLGVAGGEGPPEGEDLVEFVLEDFESEETERARAMIVRAADACELWAAEGAEAAMSRFNGPAPAS
ncbi:MAG: aminoacyl-tRNA hydrolase [bacterium]|nr:aminoacyl-tRNA hydrolase [bacterium]